MINDLPALFVGSALCTIALGLIAFGMLGRRISNIDLPIAGAFAASYGIRLILKTPTAMIATGNPSWLPYATAALDYIVPIPAALLFERLFSARLRLLNRVAVILFAVYAVVAIPYEIAVHRPAALNGVHNALVVILIVIFLLNIFVGASDPADDVRALRIGSAIFAVYVLNAHFNFVWLPFALSSEPIGFLIFIGTMVYTLIRHAIRTQMRVASVNGELAAARQIQMSILPKAPPRIAGIDVTAIYAPASEVAGDFYDFVPAGEGSVGILVADVSGHGVPAALVASMLKVALAGHADLARHPVRLLAEFNAFFCGKLERQFITAAYALLDSAGNVTVASAGHPPPLLVRSNRSVEELSVSGSLIGRFRDADFGERTTRLNGGDALVMYTDGVTEALRDGGEMWGEERFQGALARGATPTDVLAAVKAWSPTLRDDVTLVMATRGLGVRSAIGGSFYRS